MIHHSLMELTAKVVVSYQRVEQEVSLVSRMLKDNYFGWCLSLAHKTKLLMEKLFW